MVKNDAILNLESRLHIGNKKLPLMSATPTNIYIDSHSEVSIGPGVYIGPGVNIIVKSNGKLSLGSNTYFTSDVHLESVESINIGKNCAISWGVTIIDSNHHIIIHPNKKATLTNQEVSIGDHCWIGCNVTVLKGSRLGKNCIVAAGSVVTGTFPSNSLIAGNPAKVIKENIDWK